MLDVLIAGAGPAGSIAAWILARAGARVLIVDRDDFPRDTLCGDTLNPGAVRLLRSLAPRRDGLAGAHPLRGVRLTGPTADVTAYYPGDQVGVAVARRHLDAWLLDEAIRAGARFEGGVHVTGTLLDHTHEGGIVRGVVCSRRGAAAGMRLPALLTIAADGRRSALARAAGLIVDRPAPERWAYGAYAEGVEGPGDLSEMHVRPGWYAGMAPLSDGRVNVCVVRPPGHQVDSLDTVFRDAIASEPVIAARFARAVFDPRIRVLGPLAADVRAPGVPGLLLSGDAAGFVDPMTGDGMRLAMHGSVLAAREALHALETGDLTGAVARLASARARELGGKMRFNRFVRRLVDSTWAINAASIGARVVPSAVRSAVRYAGDAA